MNDEVATAALSVLFMEVNIMRAAVFCGPRDIEVADRPDPTIEN